MGNSSGFTKTEEGQESLRNSPCLGNGPYLIISVMADVVYRIQKTSRCKPHVVHGDRLKPYKGEPRTSWIGDAQESTENIVDVDGMAEEKQNNEDQQAAAAGKCRHEEEEKDQGNKVEKEKDQEIQEEKEKVTNQRRSSRVHRKPARFRESAD